jgi:hypothetical protein
VFNPVIIVAIILQSIIARSNRMAGAIAGFVITTGILLWGISLYVNGGSISFFGIPLNENFFFVLCAAWYLLDYRAFQAAQKLTKVESANAVFLNDPVNRAIWSTTWNAWRAGMTTPAQKTEADRMSEAKFAEFYIKKTGRLIQSVSTRRQFEAGEFIIYVTTNPAQDISVLTDRVLILFANKNIDAGPSYILPLSDIAMYRFDTSGKGRLYIQLRSGQVIDEQRNAAPKEEFVQRFSAARQLA